ncbi:Glutamyl-tRNA(Gln) amidotransferase subunit C, chloroplastic/mitochondrial [Vitis vinifera]|uniref:Glutamyl-tRNA(Gln) amidotransferase subunit C, chloroplastic/mitochondrial n=1 Tax=Vitis vinifera TaxID=29760 RepID=A0A438K7V3_VITVI|nr:Glutamyl-tRNA(Gln) amidotransferase subunit C, chloroplastic/mitochondrial [Vitis vinifera]RVX17288.1 Glutamyl-tRNA(Gln) amidotransferase subunit C, chloroplastic/mitochondrial [Vitis vinifera]
MGSRALLLLKATTAETLLFTSKSTFSKALIRNSTRSFSTRSALLPPDLPRLAETARISLTPHEVEEFAPKIRQVIDWFGQLQAVDLQSIEPSIRAGSSGLL